jgi:hypothetical protein
LASDSRNTRSAGTALAVGAYRLLRQPSSRPRNSALGWWALYWGVVRGFFGGETAVARVDVDDHAGLHFVVRGSRADFRTGAPAAFAVGLGVAAVGAGAGAFTLSAIGAGVNTSSSTGAEVAASTSTMALALWVGAGVAATSAAVIGAPMTSLWRLA